MATHTTNLNLIKPEDSDNYDIDDFNDNMDTIDGAVSLIGTVYSAAWIAESSSGLHVQLTDKITLPAGTYIVMSGFPTVNSSAWFTARVYDGSHAWNYTLVYGMSSAGKANVMTFTSTTTIWLASFQSGSATFASIQNGGLWAVRVA